MAQFLQTRFSLPSFLVVLLFVVQHQQVPLLHAQNHRWLEPVGELRITVDARGCGDFLSVQSAVDSVQENSLLNATILIGPGHYM